MEHRKQQAARSTVVIVISLSLPMLAPTVLAADRYVTWQGMEADKGATAWYIHRHMAPQARIDFMPYGAALGEGVAFDVPQARYRRTHNSTAFQQVLQDHPSADPVINTLADIIHDVEINAWGTKRYPQSAVLDSVLKDIASHYRDRNIPLVCFVAFFDNVYRWLGESSSTIDKLKIPRQCTSPN